MSEERCRLVFKSARCGYRGPAHDCGKTYQDCFRLGNAHNFAGLAPCPTQLVPVVFYTRHDLIAAGVLSFALPDPEAGDALQALENKLREDVPEPVTKIRFRSYELAQRLGLPGGPPGPGGVSMERLRSLG